MAKGTISKGKKAPSKHSREARRAASPGIDLDKSLKNVRAPQESTDQRPAVLAARQSGGVVKKSKTGRKAVLSTRARKRHEKSADRAEAIMDRTATKVARSKGQAKVIFSRRKAWDEINKQAYEIEGAAVPSAAAPAKLSKKAKARAEEDAYVAAFHADLDEEMEDQSDDDSAETGAAASAVQQGTFAALASAEVEVEDDIL